MTDPDTLRALAKELCEAKEGSRELDAKISAALRGCEFVKSGGAFLGRREGRMVVLHNIPLHTTSLDAKLPGEDIVIVCAPGVGMQIHSDKWMAIDRRNQTWGESHTETLARRAAALLAMATEAEQKVAEQDAKQKAHARQVRLHERAKALKDGGMRCNCDLDNWQPEASTGHSHVCRIHKAAIEAEQ